jgi:hypothetical protein
MPSFVPSDDGNRIVPPPWFVVEMLAASQDNCVSLFTTFVKARMGN